MQKNEYQFVYNTLCRCKEQSARGDSGACTARNFKSFNHLMQSQNCTPNTICDALWLPRIRVTRKGSYSPPKLRGRATTAKLVYVVRRDGSPRRQSLGEEDRVFTYEGSLSWRVGSILRDDRENMMVRMLMLLRRQQEVVVTTRMVLVADQGRAGGGGGGSRMMWW